MTLLEISDRLLLTPLERFHQIIILYWSLQMIFFWEPWSFTKNNIWFIPLAPTFGCILWSQQFRHPSTPIKEHHIGLHSY